MARKLEVQIVGDASSLQRALGSAGQSANTLGSRLKQTAKYAAVFAGAAGIGGMAIALKRGFDEMNEAQKVAAQTGAVLKSTGGSANITAKGVDNLASSLSKMSGVDDEAIASGENMLLTFTNIHNEVGRGNDIFTQATGTLLDMSTALGTDMNKSAIQLGKALNDPIKGIGALSRVGVTFTAGQKEMIKEMVASGDTMGAQKLILRELNKEFGGSAKAAGETFPGQLAKLRNAFDEAAGALVTKLLPYLTRFVEFISSNMPTIEAVMTRVFGVIGATVTTLIDIFNRVKGPVQAVFDFFRSGSDSATVATAALAAFGGAILAAVVIIETITAVTKAWAAAQVILNLAMTANPFVLLAVAIVALGAALVAAYLKSERFREFVNNAFASIKATVLPIIQTLREAWQRFGDDILSIATRVFNALRPAIMLPLQTIVGVIKALMAVFRGDWQTAWDEIKEIPVRMLRAGAALIRGLVGLWLSAARALGAAVVNGVMNVLNTLVGKVSAELSRVKGAIIGAFAGAAGWLFAAGAAIVQGMIDGIASKLGALRAKANDMKNAVKDIVPFWGSTPGEWAAYAIGAPVVQGIINGLESKLAALKGKTREMANTVVENSVNAIKDGQQKFRDAWSGYSSAALEVFDKIAGQVQTKSEKILENMRRVRAEGEISTAVTDARAGLATAQAGGDPAAIVQAQKTLDDALYRQKEYGLEQRAALERAKLDEQTETSRVRFEQWLATRTVQQQQELAKEGSGQAAIIKKIKSYNPAYYQRGIEIGESLAQGLLDRRGQVEDAANALAAAVAKAMSVSIDIGRTASGNAEARRDQIIGRIPGMATGGIVNKPTLALIGEAGPEAVVPLRGSEMVGATYINLSFPSYVGDHDDLIRTVRAGLAEVARDNPNIFAGKA